MPDGGLGRTVYLGIDASKAQEGARLFEQAVDRIAAKAGSTASAVGTVGGSFDRLADRIGPATRAEREFASSQASLERSVARGNTALGQHAEALRRTGEAAERASVASGRFRGVLMNFATGLAGGLGIGAALGFESMVRGFLEASDAAQRLDNQLRIATGSTAGAQQAFAGLYEIAQRTSTPIESIATLYGRVSIASKELNANQGDVLKLTEAVANALRVGGGSAESASGAMLQLSQSLGGGTVHAEEFNSMLEGMLPLLQAAARHVDGAGGSVARLRQMVVDGKLSSEAFFRAIVAGGDDLAQTAQSMEITMGQALTNISNAFVRLAGNISQATGTTYVWKSAMLEASKIFDTVSANFEAAQGKVSAQIQLQQQRVNTLKKIAESEAAAAGKSAGASLPWGNPVSGSFSTGSVSSSLSVAERELARLKDLQTMDDVVARIDRDAERRKARSLQVDTPPTINDNVQRLRISRIQEEAQATKDLTEKTQKLIEAATLKRDMDVREVQANKKKFGTDSDAKAAVDEINKQYDAQVRLIKLQETKTGATSSGRTASRARTEALKDEGADAREALRLMREQESSMQALARLHEEASASADDLLERIESQRQRRVAELDKLNNITPEQRRAGLLDIEAINARQHRDYYDQQQRDDRSKQDLLAGAQARSLDARASMATDSGESQNLQLQAIEVRRQMAIRAIDDEQTRFRLAESEKVTLVRATNDEFDAQRKKLTDSADTYNEGINAAFNILQQSISTVFADMILEGNITAETIVRSFERAFLQLAISNITKAVIQPGVSGLGSWLSGLFSGAGAGGSYGTTGSGGMAVSGGTNPGFLLGGAAQGAAFDRGNVIPFARGGVVDRPMLFPMARGSGLMGEAGPEAVLPLRRLASGNLGVEATGKSNAPVVNVNVVNNAQANVSVEQRRSGKDNGLDLDVLITSITNHVAAEAQRPGTNMNRALAVAANPVKAR